MHSRDMRAMIAICAALLTTGCDGCGCGKKQSTRAGPTPSTSVSTRKAMAPPKEHKLKPRIPVSHLAVGESRPKILKALDEANRLAGEGKHEEALATLTFDGRQIVIHLRHS